MDQWGPWSVDPISTQRKILKTLQRQLDSSDKKSEKQERAHQRGAKTYLKCWVGRNHQEKHGQFILHLSSVFKEELLDWQLSSARKRNAIDSFIDEKDTIKQYLPPYPSSRGSNRNNQRYLSSVPHDDWQILNQKNLSIRAKKMGLYSQSLFDAENYANKVRNSENFVLTAIRQKEQTHSTLEEAADKGKQRSLKWTSNSEVMIPSLSEPKL